MLGSVAMLSTVVTTAATAVPLTTVQTFAAAFVIQAKSGNSGAIYVGDANVTAATGMKIGKPPTFFADVTLPAFTMASGDSSNLFDLSSVFICSDSDGDGVNTMYFTR